MGLSVADLSCTRGGRPVLHGIGFALADGEALVLRGPNGAGKSTLLRALAGLLPADRPRSRSTARRRADADAWAERVAYAGHLDAVKPQLTVAENLAFWAALFGGDGRRRRSPPSTSRRSPTGRRSCCSAGQKRRLGLARLLLAPRRLWLLDEPTVALDAAADGAAARRGPRPLRRRRPRGRSPPTPPLDLAPARELALAPAAVAAARAAADPFLAGRWA